nr:enoyl-CoA delta isomerase 1, peroxisomal-like [Ipomoea trifida]
MCTLEKRGNIFILTLTGEADHRLNPTLIDSITAAVRRARSEATAPSALITTAQGKFFSNGYDLKWAKQDMERRAKIMSSKLRLLVAELINLPMPTIAAVTGHASAAGFVLALCHDYILMRRDRGFLYMSELDIGLRLPAWFIALMKCKIGSPVALREVALASAKLTGDIALQRGIVDSVHNNAEETLKAAEKLGEELVRRNWDGNTYSGIRTTLFAQVLDSLESDETVGDFGKKEAKKTVSRL